MGNVGLNDKAWQQLFTKYDILNHVETNGSFNISADQIREFREPRLMAKFDHTVNLPDIFAENKLAILPTSRGDYAISHFDAYHAFEENSACITQASLPSYIQSLDCNDITSEAKAINCAAAAGIIEDFINDTDIVATVSGRMSSGEFSFYISDTKYNGTHQIKVSNSQIEIDAAYEGVESLALIEAKLDLSEDFLIRQLYYPFRTWQSRIAKPVKPIFLVYSNGIYRMYEYAFENEQNYNSLKLVKQQNYSIEDTSISVSDIQIVLNSVKVIEEPKIPFPQADKFERVINLCELVDKRRLSRSDVTEQYDFDPRQTNYYTDAARYLGLLEREELENGTLLYSISATGKNILHLSFKQRQLAFCRCILSHSVFNRALALYLRYGVMPSTNEIVAIMKESDLYNVKSDETFRRRASTVKCWLNWIISLINE